jgi:hypothetical protein
MRRPVRLNRAAWQRVLRTLHVGCPDPRRLLDAGITAREFTEAIAAVKIDGVFKTTRSNRFPRTRQLLAGLRFPSPPVVIDVGASDGSTSLDVIEAIEYSRYYVTDRHTEARTCATRNGIYFCDAASRPFMYANRFFVVYNDLRRAWWPFSWLVPRFFARFDVSGSLATRRVMLVNPELVSRLGDGIRLEQYSIFDPWPFEKADLVIAANILNRSYFSDAKLVEALRNLRAAMKASGRLAVIENRSVEQSTIFRLDGGRFTVEREVETGSDIRSLVSSLS